MVTVRAVPSPSEIAYQESVRTLEGQTQDLANIRAHVSLALSAGGIAAGFLGGQAPARGPAFWVAVCAFVVLACLTIAVYRPVEFPNAFDAYQLVDNYVDATPPVLADTVMRDLAIHSADDARVNKMRLRRLFMLQSMALLSFGVEVLALAANLATE